MQELLNNVFAAQSDLDTSATGFAAALSDLVAAESVYQTALSNLATARANNSGVDAAADQLIGANADRADCQTAYNLARVDLVTKRSFYNAAVLALVASSLSSLVNPGIEGD